MIAPDVEVEGKGIILISSEEGATEGIIAQRLIIH
jgi:hypothetical protein